MLRDGDGRDLREYLIATAARLIGERGSAGLVSQPGVLGRFHAMVGGDAAFVGGGERRADQDPAPGGPRGLPDTLRGYLLAEQRLGRIDPAADVDAAVTLIVGTIHGEILPRVMFAPPGRPVTTEPGLAGRVAETILRGIAGGPAR